MRRIIEALAEFFDRLLPKPEPRPELRPVRVRARDRRPRNEAPRDW